MLKRTSPPPAPPSHHTGKLKTGLTCHHSFNNDKRYYVTSSIEKDVDRLIQDLDKAFAKYRDAYHIGSKSKTSEARKRKEQRKKSKNRRLNASNSTRKRACIIFRSLGGEPVELCYEQHIYGIQQIDSVDEETLLLFTSKPTKLVYEICLILIVLWGKLKNKFMIFALHRISSIN